MMSRSWQPGVERPGPCRLERRHAATILFLCGWNFALPVAAGLPIWLTPVQVTRGVFLTEVLLVAYLLVWVAWARRGRTSVPQKAIPVVVMVTLFSCLGAASASVNFRPWIEVVGAGRYLLLATLLLLAVGWARTSDRMFPLRWLLLGTMAAGLVNLYYTFTTSPLQIAGVRLLLGQNGPGGHLGLSAILGAWLYTSRERPVDAPLGVAAATCGLVAAAVSYSKTAMLLAALGVIAWAAILVFDTAHRRRWWLVVPMMLVLGPALTISPWSEAGSGAVGQLIDVVRIKLLGSGRSVASRSSYFGITSEIVTAHPMFGVSYGGFYDAAVRTRTYQTQRALREALPAGGYSRANPHNTFLYYAAANGIPGLALAICLFITAMGLLAQSIANRGVASFHVALCVIAGYFVFASTLPTLFNTVVLYVPLATTLAEARPT